MFFIFFGKKTSHFSIYYTCAIDQVNIRLLLIHFRKVEENKNDNIIDTFDEK